MKQSILIISLFLLVCFQINAQYFIYDSLAVNYEVISVGKARNIYVSNLRKAKREANKRPDYEKKERNIDQYKKAIKYYKHSEISKNAYIILLKNTDNDNCHIVVSVKTKEDEGKRIRVGKIYKIKLEQYFKKDWIISIGGSLTVEINGVKILIHHNRWTGNIYIAPNIKGLYYCP